MSPQAQPLDDLEEAERIALEKAIAEAEADPRGVPREEMPPTPRPLSEL